MSVRGHHHHHPHAPTPVASSSMAHNHAHAHHHHVHVHPQRERTYDPGADLNGRAASPKDLSSVSRKRPRHQQQLTDEASFLPSNDRNEWYYPTANHIDPDSVGDIDYSLASGAGNWGNKLDKRARWTRKGKIVAWGPTKADWDLEERARKRLKQIMPAPPHQRESSPPPTLFHLRSTTPPLTDSYGPSNVIHSDYTSLILDPAVQHAFTSPNISELEGTATELIAGEGALRRAFGGLWRALQGEMAAFDRRIQEESNTPKTEFSDEQPDEDILSQLQPRKAESENSVLEKLFITPSTITLPGPDPKTFLAPQSQVESLQWALGVLRELGDDGKEYTARLEEIRDGLGQAGAVRAAVWRECRIEALDEMTSEG